MPSLLDVLSGIGSALDTYSGAGSVRDLIAGENPWDQFVDPFNEEKRVSGRQMLEKQGWVGENEDQGWIPDLGDLGGFAAEMALDPSMLIGGGLGLAKRLMGISKAKATNRGIEAANALSREQRAMGFMPEEVAKLTKIVDETGKPKKMYHGTPHVFDKFDDAKLDPGALYGKGIYTTDSPAIASEYAGKGESDAIQNALNADQRLTDLRRRESVVKQYTRRIADRFRNVSTREIDGLIDDDARFNQAWNLRERLQDELQARTDDITANAAARNVRQHFIDARNPLDMDGFLDANSPVLRAALEKRIGTPDSWADWGTLRDDALDATGPSSTGSAAWNALRGTGEAVNDVLRESGFDAITHQGGRTTGGAPHNVVIALDPKNVYLPYIAKELQDLQRVASPNSLLASLAGYNALAHSDLETDE